MTPEKSKEDVIKYEIDKYLDEQASKVEKVKKTQKKSLVDYHMAVD